MYLLRLLSDTMDLTQHMGITHRFQTDQWSQKQAFSHSLSLFSFADIQSFTAYPTPTPLPKPFLTEPGKDSDSSHRFMQILPTYRNWQVAYNLFNTLESN